MTVLVLSVDLFQPGFRYNVVSGALISKANGVNGVRLTCEDLSCMPSSPARRSLTLTRLKHLVGKRVRTEPSGAAISFSGKDGVATNASLHNNAFRFLRISRLKCITTRTPLQTHRVIAKTVGTISGSNIVIQRSARRKKGFNLGCRVAGTSVRVINGPLSSLS